MKKFGIILFAIGVVLMLYPPFTFFYSEYEQSKLRSIYSSQTLQISKSENNKKHKISETSSFKSFDDNVFGIIEIPSINLSAVVIPGTSPEDLKKGPGWYTESALPGEGNTAIAAHRTTYGAWFFRLNQLKTGELIKLTSGNKVFTYRVEKVFIINKDDWSVINPCGYPALTLTTCHPMGSSSERLVVRARLIQSLPLN
ncbi:sortase [Aceticella autotrophica]|nr:class E sortase [Aceticella autotrophica]